MQKTDNIRLLIGEMEYIVANCYYNKQPRGGHYFRYPYTFILDGKKYQRKGKAFLPKIEEINTMRYVNGANNLYIGKALLKILEFLENRYDLDFDELESEFEDSDDSDDVLLF